MTSQRYWIPKNIWNRSESFALDDEIFLIAYLSPFELWFFGILYLLFPFITHLFLHSPHRVFRVWPFDNVLSISPVWCQIGSRSLIKLARQLSSRIHVERVTVVIYVGIFYCFFDCFWTQIGRWLVLFPFWYKKISILFFLFFVVKSTVHGGAFIVVVLKEFLCVVLNVNVDVLVTIIEVSFRSSSQISHMNLVRFLDIKVIKKSLIQHRLFANLVVLLSWKMLPNANSSNTRLFSNYLFWEGVSGKLVSTLRAVCGLSWELHLLLNLLIYRLTLSVSAAVELEKDRDIFASIFFEVFRGLRLRRCSCSSSPLIFSMLR